MFFNLIFWFKHFIRKITNIAESSTCLELQWCPRYHA